MCVKIVSNYQPREIIEAWELTNKERAEFNYINWKAIDDGTDSAQFFRYKGQLYDLNEFQVVKDNTIKFASWQGYVSDTFFSGVVIRYVDLFESVIVGHYYI